MYYRNYSRPELPAVRSGFEDSFHLYYRIPAVVLIYGTQRRLHADEHTHAGRLMKSLHWLGKEGIPLRGVICERSLLDRSSLRALNLYLKHGEGLDAFRRAGRYHHGRHKYGWADLQEILNLRWRPHA